MGKNQRHVGLWDPVVLAAGLHEQNRVPLHKLKLAFRSHAFLKSWEAEFEERNSWML